MSLFQKTFVASVVLSAISLSHMRPCLAQVREAATVQTATEVLEDINRIPGSAIPQSMMSNANAIAIIPNLIKIGFVGSVRHGRGIVVVREGDGSWSNPIFVAMTGGGVGFQVGAQATDVILVFKSRESVAGMLSGKFTLGADAAVAAGPIGRQATAATDTQLRAEILSYSRSRGVFAGVSLDGSVLSVDNIANSTFYGVAGVPTADVFTRRGQVEPPQVIALKATLAKYSAPMTSTNRPTTTGVTTTPITPVTPSTPPTTIVIPQPPENVAARDELAKLSQTMFGVLDEAWRSYLALPVEVFEPQGVPSIGALQTSFNHYETVEFDPKYEVINRLPEFQKAHLALRRYMFLLKRTEAIAAASALPKPPGFWLWNR